MLDLPPPDPRAEIVLASRGISKGVTQTDGAQLVVRAEIGLGAVFVGGQYKNISSPTADGEASFIFGFRKEVGSVDVTATATYKSLTGLSAQADPDTWEFTASGTRKFGLVTPRIALIYSFDDIGSTGRSIYLEGGASLTITRRAAIIVNLGHRARKAASDYISFNVGVSYQLQKGVAVDVRYYDTNRGNLGSQFQNRLVGALRAQF